MVEGSPLAIYTSGPRAKLTGKWQSQSARKTSPPSSGRQSDAPSVPRTRRTVARRDPARLRVALGLQDGRGTMCAMTSIPPGEYVPTADERVVMYDVSWEHYEMMLEARGERSQPRMAYLDGALELMTTSHGHEGVLSWIVAMLTTYLLDAEIRFGAYGHWTLRQGAAKKAGIEADNCFQFGDDQTERMPDLALEVRWTSGGIDKLEIYRRLGVREVWFWEEHEILVFVLVGEQYERRQQSTFVPALDLSLVARLVAQPTINDAVRELRAVTKAR